jgi:hypothetical protein
MSDTLVRLRPSDNGSHPPPPKDDQTAVDFYAWQMVRRETLATELRAIEDSLMRQGMIKNRLCGPARMR